MARVHGLHTLTLKSRKTCLQRISNSHFNSRGLNVLLGRMLDLLKTETMVSKNPATSAFGLGSPVFRDHSLGFKKVYPTLNMIESSSIREWSGTNVDFDWQCRWWTQKPSAIQVRALNKTTVVQDHRKNTC